MSKIKNISTHWYFYLTSSQAKSFDNNFYNKISNFFRKNISLEQRSPETQMVPTALQVALNEDIIIADE